ncbi:unnamed protein product [Lactuca virosa]|uniref:Transposase Tnp1/En/Spm-like domain-containing protein n=1 Tax=Lactuca virosa TaxID=75947 RepID=A0AAU9MNB2_9ASTR|nr:unnamed protein product [Lactuca virosa]
MLELKNLNPRDSRKSTWLQSQHSRAFSSWFKKEVEKRLANGENICDDVRWLVKGPSFVVSKYSGFAINEYLFHITSRDESRTIQCNGVSLAAHIMQIAIAKHSNTMYGVVTYFSRVVGKEATKLYTFEGLVARTVVPITYSSWLEVGAETKEEQWQYVLEKFVVDPKSRKHTLQLIGKKWRNFKHYLYVKFIKKKSKDPKLNLLKPLKDYPFLKKEDWKIIVSHRVTKKWEDKSMKAKNVRAHHKYNHRLSRKGYAGLINDIMQETGKTKEENDKTMLWKKARELKTGGYESNVKMIVDRLNSGSFGEITCGTHDVLTEALAVSCQVGVIIEDVEKEPPEESLDNSCLLAVDFAANVVAKGTIMKYSASDENIQVMMETILQGEALLPIPLEEDFIMKVKDALGHILSWPRHLVIRCSDLVILFSHTP